MRYLGPAMNVALGLVLFGSGAGAQANPTLRPFASLSGVSPDDFAVMPNGR
jgi:hypothetical protein